MDAQIQALTAALTSAMQGVTGTKLYVQTFSGLAKDNINDWLALYNKSASSAGWTEVIKLSKLHEYLEQPALSWYIQQSALPENKDLSWPTWEARLEAKFRKNAATVQCHLNTRKLNDGEEIESYATAISSLCRSLNPTMTDAERVNYLMNGIPAPINMLVGMMTPATPEDFVAKYKQICALFLRGQSLQSPATPNLFGLPANAQQTVTPQPIVQPTLATATEDIGSIVNKAVSDALNRQRNNYRGRYRNGGRGFPHANGNSNHTTNRKHCVGCGRNGHLLSECIYNPNRIRDNNTRGRSDNRGRPHQSNSGRNFSRSPSPRRSEN